MRSGRDRTSIPIKKVEGKSGRSILVEEETDRLVIDRFNNELATADRGLVFSPTSEKKLGPRLDGGEVRWISRARGGLNPSRLDYDIYQEISKFYKDVGGTVLLLGVEYLCHINGFRSVIRFINKVGDRASSTDGSLLAGVNPLALDEKEVAVLEKAFDYVERSGVGARVVERLSPGEERKGWSYLFLDPKAYSGMKRSAEGSVCLTTSQPDKVRRWEDFRGDILWVSESEEKDAIHPAKLRFEAQQRVMRNITDDGKRVFLDGLENLIMFTDLAEVVGLVKSLSDACSQSDVTLMASLDPKALERYDFALLRKLFDKVIG